MLYAAACVHACMHVNKMLTIQIIAGWLLASMKSKKCLSDHLYSLVGLSQLCPECFAFVPTCNPLNNYVHADDMCIIIMCLLHIANICCMGAACVHACMHVNKMLTILYSLVVRCPSDTSTHHII